jgi:ribosome modulation factor
MNTKWAMQLTKIYTNGMKAFKGGVKIAENPYRTGSGNLQRQRRKYWADGWRQAEKDEANE